MATNKWLQGLKALEGVKNSLKTSLQNRKIQVKNSDTLISLCEKVKELPEVDSDTQTWTPDPKWVFNDPNGSETKKNIRQIYDEDTLASDYTYRGIYMLNDYYDSMDLKAVMGARTNADTFITSDGSIYSNVTDTSLTHNWNKSLDVEDSLGNKVRYVRVYSNSSYNYIPSFYQSVIWCITNLGPLGDKSHATYAPAAASLANSIDLQCLEYGDKVTQLYAGGLSASNLFSLRKVSADNPVRLITSSSNGYCFASSTAIPYLEHLDLKITSSITDNSYSTSTTAFRSWPNLISIDLSHVTASGFYMYNYQDCPVKYLKNLSSIPSTSLTLIHFNNMEELALPQSVKTLKLGDFCLVKNLTIPEGVTDLNLSGSWVSLKELSLQSSPAVVSINITAVKLDTINLQPDFNGTLSVGSSPLLKKDSIVNMLDCLKDLTGEASKTLTLGATNLAKLTDEEKAIATNKNWKLA